MMDLGYLKVACRLGLNYCLNSVYSRVDDGLCKPYYINFDVTERCNLKCRHCDIWSLKEHSELNTEECKNALNSLRSWLGPFFLNIAGGEPLVRRDLMELIEYCTERDIATKIATNGVLIDKRKAKEIENAGLDMVTISLDGSTPESHDYIRGKGNYNKALDAIKHLKELDNGPKINICTVLMKNNISELPDLVKLAEDNNVKGIMFEPLGDKPARDYKTGWYEESELWPDYSEVSKRLDELIDLKKNGKRILNPIKQLKLMKDYFRNPDGGVNEECSVGLRNYRIKPNGEVYLCHFMESIGNIKSMSAKEIWDSSKAKEIRGRIKECKIRGCTLKNCNYNASLIDNIKRFSRLFS